LILPKKRVKIKAVLVKEQILSERGDTVLHINGACCNAEQYFLSKMERSDLRKKFIETQNLFAVALEKEKFKEMMYLGARMSKLRTAMKEKKMRIPRAQKKAA
jgi:hypothetical protein